GDAGHGPRLLPVAAHDGARAARARAGAESHLAVLRRRGLARPLDRARPARPRRPHRARRAARPVETDQSAVVSGSDPRSPDAARVRAVRPDVPARPERRPRARVRGVRRAVRARRAAVRALQHRPGAFQIRGWMGAHAVPAAGPPGGNGGDGGNGFTESSGVTENTHSTDSLDEAFSNAFEISRESPQLAVKSRCHLQYGSSCAL